MHQTSAQAYGRALTVWGQWLRHWGRTSDPRALGPVYVCESIAAEKLAVWQAELKSRQSALLAAREERAARTELAVDKILREIRRDGRALRTTQLADAGGDPVVDELAERLMCIGAGV